MSIIKNFVNGLNRKAGTPVSAEDFAEFVVLAMSIEDQLDYETEFKAEAIGSEKWVQDQLLNEAIELRKKYMQMIKDSANMVEAKVHWRCKRMELSIPDKAAELFAIWKRDYLSKEVKKHG